ncbi:MAG: tetratricopeptide repeat protein [Candidatus Melainabacteria bacterium]|nr:tetratricopeptide repeat protein [Candidatus Melainabacteria bacterium]
MRVKKGIGRAALCLAQSAFLIFGNAGVALAAANFSSAEMTRIQNSERSIFGKTKDNLSSESRLRALETNLFGDVKKGSVDSRLDKVEETLKIDRSALLQAPAAAQLDQAPVQQAPAAVAADYDAEPKSPAGDLVQRAMEQYSAGDTTTAEKTFKRALSVDKNNADAHFNLGVLYEGKGDLNGALASYTKAQALNPSDNELRDTVQSLRTKIAQEQNTKLAEARQAQEQEQGAKLRDGLRQQVADASAAYKSGNFTDAAKKLERVASQAPNDPDVQYALGQAYRASNDDAKAKLAFSRAASIDPKSDLYKKALQEVGQSAVANRPPSALPQSIPSTAPAPSYDSSANDSTPAGQLTPFAQSAKGYGSESFGSQGGGSFLNGGASTAFRSTRMKRAIAGGAVGAAAGALFGMNSRGGMKSSAMKGALLGGMLGYMTGR